MTSRLAVKDWPALDFAQGFAISAPQSPAETCRLQTTTANPFGDEI